MRSWCIGFKATRENLKTVGMFAHTVVGDT